MSTEHHTTTISPISHATVMIHTSQNAVQRFVNRVVHALQEHYRDERGMSTVEYALGTVAAAAFGALLYTIVTSDTVEQALTSIFERALNER